MWQSEKLFLRLLVLVLFTKVIVTVVTQWIHVISHVCLVLKFDNEVDMLDEIPLYFLVSKAYWPLTPHVYQRGYNLGALYWWCNWCMCTKVENCTCFWHLLNRIQATVPLTGQTFWVFFLQQELNALLLCDLYCCLVNYHLLTHFKWKD